MTNMRLTTACLVLLLVAQPLFAQQPPQPQTDTTTPLHMLQPDYPVPYGVPKPEEVARLLNLIHAYLDETTPTGFVNRQTNLPLTDYSSIDRETILRRGDFRLVSYEWGVTYAGMLLASEATGDPRFRDYAERRLQFIADSAPFVRKTAAEHAGDWGSLPLRNLLAPRALDDCGAMCAAMIKAKRAGSRANLQPLIETAARPL